MMAQKIFLPRQRPLKGARIGAIVALVKSQQRGSILKGDWAHFVGAGSVAMDLLNRNRMLQIIQDVDIAKLAVEVGYAIKQQKGLLTLSGIRDRVMHECCGDSLMSIC